MSEYICYCLKCNKFFYSEQKHENLIPCQHCKNITAVCTDHTKDAYLAMSDSEKDVFKQEIRNTYPSYEDYIAKKAAERRKEEFKKINRIVVTTGDLKEDYEILGPVYYQISNRGLFTDEIMRKSNEYREMFAEMQTSGFMTTDKPDWGFLYGNYSVGQDKFEQAFFIAVQELKKKAYILKADAVICMRQDIDLETEHLNNFYLQMYGTAVKKK